MPESIHLVRSAVIRTAVIRAKVSRADLARFVPAACGEVWSYIQSAGLRRPGRHVALYGPEEGLVEVGAEIGEAFDGNGRVCCSQLPAEIAATMTHFGPYHHLGRAHAAIREWCAAQGYEMSGICWEIYDHWQDDWNNDSGRIRTDVFHHLRHQPNPTGNESA